MVTTIHGFSSPNILPVYHTYNNNNYYVSISIADRNPQLDYFANVYHGIDLDLFSFNDNPDDYLLYFGRIHPDKGTYDAIQIARRLGMRLVMAGIIQDQNYYQSKVAPYLDQNVVYVGSVGPESRSELLRGLWPYCIPYTLPSLSDLALSKPWLAERR